MEKLMKQIGKGKMPNLGQLQNGAQQPAQSYTRTTSATKKSRNKRKKRARR
jgi:hypothetical protein